MAKKKRKAVLPKRIAGVKVPRSVRRGRFGELLASRTGRALLAEAIMAAGGEGAARKTNNRGELRRGLSSVAERLQDGSGARFLAGADQPDPHVLSRA